MICPNCGKDVAQNAEQCPFCHYPTQFSSRMKYYPRSTPLTPSSSAKTSQEPMRAQQVVQGKDELKEILARLSDIPKKKEMTNNIAKCIIAVSVIGIICVALLFGGVAYLSNRIKTNKTATDLSLSRVENRVIDLSSSVSELETAIDEEIEDSKKQTESLPSAIEESVFVSLYCNYPDVVVSSPLCFVLNKGMCIKLPTLSCNTHLFIGWKEKDSENLISPNEIYQCEGDGTIELFACWETVVTPPPEATPTPSSEPSATPNGSQQPFHQPGFPFGNPNDQTGEPTTEPAGNSGNE